MNYSSKTIPLQDIDLDDSAFRLSYGFDLEPLTRSISRIGMINPPLLRKRPDGRYQIICGYRRICALRELGASPVSYKLVPPETSDEACLLLSLYDTVAHRDLNPIEKSLALNRLLSYYREEKIVSDFLPLLKLQPHITQIRAYQPLCLLDKEIRDALLQDIIDIRTALRLAQMDPESRECLAHLLISLRLSFSKQAEVISTVAEIGLRDGISPRTMTGDPEIRSILTNDKLNWPQKGDSVLRILREKRYPQLTAKEKQVKGMLSKVKLPHGISITPPPFFEDNCYCLSVYFAGWQELREKLNLLDAIIADDLPNLE